MDRRLADEHRAMAQAIGRIVMRHASARNEAGETIVPNTRAVRTTLKRAIWAEVVQPYYIGRANDPFVGAAPQSPYARLLFEGIEGAIRIQAERQIALIRQVVSDQQVLNWLTGPRPVRTQEFGVYDPFHLWVDPNGYRLDDRIWRASIEVRARIDELLDYHIAAGTSAIRIAELLEPFLTPAGAERRTRRPYGTQGSYAARRLTRTEITAAAGRATINASVINPFVVGIRWALSAAHPKFDVCDGYAKGGENGDGVYPKDQVPTYPPHPHCLCNLQPVPAGSVADLIETLRRDIRAYSPRARRLQGAFNLEWMVSALLNGFFVESLLGEVA